MSYQIEYRAPSSLASTFGVRRVGELRGGEGADAYALIKGSAIAREIMKMPADEDFALVVKALIKESLWGAYKGVVGQTARNLRQAWKSRRNFQTTSFGNEFKRLQDVSKSGRLSRHADYLEATGKGTKADALRTQAGGLQERARGIDENISTRVAGQPAAPAAGVPAPSRTAGGADAPAAGAAQTSESLSDRARQQAQKRPLRSLALAGVAGVGLGAGGMALGQNQAQAPGAAPPTEPPGSYSVPYGGYTYA